MFDNGKKIIAVKARSINEDKGLVYPLFIEDNGKLDPALEVDFPNNGLIVVHENKAKNSYYSDVDAKYNNLELFNIIAYLGDEDVDNKDKLTYCKYWSNPVSFSKFNPQNMYSMCAILKGNVYHDKPVFIECPIEPLNSFFFVENDDYIYGPFKLKSKVPLMEENFGYLLELIPDEKLKPFSLESGYSSYHIFKVKKSDNNKNYDLIHDINIDLNKIEGLGYNNPKLNLLFIDNAIDFIKKSKGDWVDFMPDEALFSWGASLVNDKLSKSITFQHRREMTEALRHQETSDKDRLNRLINLLNREETSDKITNDLIFNYVKRKDNLLYFLDIASNDINNIIENNPSLNNKFRFSEREELKKKNVELNNLIGSIRQENTSLENQIKSFKDKHILDMSDEIKNLEETIKLKKNELDTIEITVDYPVAKNEYDKLKKEIQDLEIKNTLVKGEVERLIEQKDALLKEIPKVKNEYKNEIYKLVPIVKMMNEDIVIQNEYDYSQSTKDGYDFSAKDIINNLYLYFSDIGRKLSKKDIVNLVVSFMNNYLTILYGIPGVGKTSLVSLLSKSLGVNFNKISVNKGWTSSKDLIGYYNSLSGSFVNAETNLRPFLENSILDREKENACPYWILLDEANLSPIEYYWSNFLSIADDSEKKLMLNLSQNNIKELSLNESIRFIATINMDETTERLSPRVINRSCVIYLDSSNVSDNIAKHQSKFEKNVNYVSLRDNFTYEYLIKDNKDGEKYGQDALDNIYGVLMQENSKKSIMISKRKKDMIRRYIDTMILVSSIVDGLDYDNSEVVDLAISQYILPEIRGSGENFKSILNNLAAEISVYPNSHNIVMRIIEDGDDNYGSYDFFSS